MIMRFKIGDKVVLKASSGYYRYQQHSNNGKLIPKTISKVLGMGWDYETEEGYSYDDIDLDPYLENTEPNYEVY